MKITNTEKISSHAQIQKQDRIKQAETLLKGANMAKECVKAVMETMNPDFCWKKGGDVGKIPYGCPRGWFRDGALCYENCRRDFHFTASRCQNGSDYYFPSSLSNFSDSTTCEPGYYKSGALCYKDCANIGMENCGIGACSQDSSKCASQIVQMALDVVTGVATFALLIASFGTSSAGAGQGVGTAARTATRSMTQTLKTSAWQKLKTSFTKHYQKTVERASKAFMDNLREIPLDKGLEWYAKNVCGDIWKGIQGDLNKKDSPPGEIDIGEIAKKFDVLGVSDIVEACKKGEKEKCAQKSMEFASTFDPTGLLTIAAAFVLPTCNADPITSNTDVYKILSVPKYFCKECSDLKSNAQEAGNRGVEYLDRHPITCASNQLLNFFSFTFDNNKNKLISNYKCITPSTSISNCWQRNSNWDHLPRNTGSINFLDRHSIECDNGFIQSVILATHGDYMRYEATCCNINVWGGDRNKVFSTNKNGLAGWYVDQFKDVDGIDAGQLSAISYFRPRTDGSHFFYDYKVGRVVFASEASSYYEGATKWDDAGEGSIWNLDRHVPWCDRPNSAMTSFNFERNGDLIRYAYKCIQNTKIQTDGVQILYTEWNDVGGYEQKAIHYLDRHMVLCPGNSVLRGFVVNRQERPGNLMRIVYGCAPAELGDNRTNRTWKSDMGNRNNFYLDRQTYLPLGPDEVLQGFKLEAKFDPDTIDYFYTAVSLYKE